MAMDKSDVVRNVGIKLPIGFRFHPTDEELVVHYLRRKVFSFPLPASVIPEVDVFQVNPWDLPGEPWEQRYFFCRRKGNAAKSSRSTGSGYWKDVGKEKFIVASGSNQVVGVKKSLVFCNRKRPRALRTRWVMHEYRLLGFRPTSNFAQKSVIMETEEWVVCRICQKKRKPKNKSYGGQAAALAKGNKTRSITVDIIMEESGSSGPPQPSLSCSSGITELSHNPSDQEETSSYLVSSVLNY
ncbi:hypothetical protein NMG60_11006881 [Bertholletia excelsa]